MKDRRTQKTGRRDYEQSGEYIFGDNEDRLITNDRRRVPDRRTDNVEVDWIDEDLEIIPTKS